MVATFRATQTYDWPTNCDLGFFYAAYVKFYSHVSIIFIFNVCQKLYCYYGTPPVVGLSEAGLVFKYIME